MSKMFPRLNKCYQLYLNAKYNIYACDNATVGGIHKPRGHDKYMEPGSGSYYFLLELVDNDPLRSRQLFPGCKQWWTFYQFSRSSKLRN